MAAIAPNVLLEESKCYACFDPATVPGLAALALISRISQNSNETTWLTSWVPGPSRNNFTGSAGARIQIGAANVIVSKLGLYVVAGGTQVHTLSIWTDACVLVASASIDFTGLSGANYVAITPATLNSGAFYRLSLSTVNLGDSWTGNVGSVFSSTSVATTVDGAFGVAIACPNQVAGILPPYVGMDFKYTSP